MIGMNMNNKRRRPNINNLYGTAVLKTQGRKLRFRLLLEFPKKSDDGPDII
jgi:hypothetical protein